MSKTESELEMTCGVVMPISETEGCSESHWKDVKRILFEAIKGTDFTPKLVNDSIDVGVIQKRIVQNLYDNEIVVVDVSCRNPNVMLELGMRLAFDKPTIIVKDDVTEYSFDTSPIEHLGYRRDLRHYEIEKFKKSLEGKIRATYEASKKEKYTTFLKYFGDFVVAKLKKKEGSKEDYIIQELRELRKLVGGSYSRPDSRSILENRKGMRRASRGDIITEAIEILVNIPDGMDDEDRIEQLEEELSNKFQLARHFDSKEKLRRWARDMVRAH